MAHLATFSPDGKHGSFPNDFSFVIDSSANNGNIRYKDGSVIYRGIILKEDDDPFKTYFNLIGTNPEMSRIIKVSEIEMLPDDMFVTDGNSVRIDISKEEIGARIQVVEIPPLAESNYDTNLVIINHVTSKNPCYITLPDDFKGKEYIIWINSKCKKINA